MTSAFERPADCPDSLRLVRVQGSSIMSKSHIVSSVIMKRLLALSASLTILSAAAKDTRGVRSPAIQTSRHLLSTEGESCQSDTDCINFACAREKAFPDSPLVCCESGDYFFTGFSLGNVCTWQDTGAECLNNRDELCLSDVCVDGKCMEEPMDDLEPCDNGSDCQSRECGRATASLDDGSNQVCCPGGISIELFIFGKTCGNQPDGMPCGGEDGLCANGECINGYCGGVEIPPASGSGGDGSDKLGAGQQCQSDDDCQSNFCIFNKCGTGIVAPDWPAGGGDVANGEQCQEDAECQAAACVDNMCTDIRDINESCDTNSDCLNGACGLKSLNNTDKVCCPTGLRFNAVCTGQPDGARCIDPRNGQGMDDVCASEYCCTTCRICKTRKEAGQPCDFDDDCIERQCADNGMGQRICCPGGTITAVTGECAESVPVDGDTTSSAAVGGRNRISGAAATVRHIAGTILAVHIVWIER